MLQAMFTQYIVMATFRLRMCRHLTVMWRQFIRRRMWRRGITDGGIHGTMLRDATTTAESDEGFIATGMTFTGAVANTGATVQTAVVKQEIRNTLKQERVEHERTNINFIGWNAGICVCVLGAKCYGVGSGNGPNYKIG